MGVDLVGQEADTPGNALAQAFARKWKQVGEACKYEDILFVPVPAEKLGGWSDSAV